VSTPSQMPQRRPVHPVRPPLDFRPVPRWHCRKVRYATRAAAEAALSEIWARPGARQGPMEAHAYLCRRHEGREVWHLTKQDQDHQQERRTS
jgi:hypothetical protein